MNLESKNTRTTWFLCASSGILLALSFPPLPFGFAVFAGLVPFFFAFEGQTRGGKAFKIGWFTGFVYFLCLLHWIAFLDRESGAGAALSVPGTVALAAYEGLYIGIFSLLLHLAKRWGRFPLWISAPSIWVSLEYARSLTFMGFPWGQVGYALAPYPSLIQYATYTSVLGASFLVVLVNYVIYRFLKAGLERKPLLAWFLLAAGIIGVVHWSGRRTISAGNPGRSVRIAVIQPNIDPNQKWNRENRQANFDTLFRLTRQAALENPDLVVWPETATPVYLRYNRLYRQMVESFVRKMKIPLLTGTPDYRFQLDGTYKSYNAAFLFDENGRFVDEYAKLHLVPFGEMIPFEDRFKFLKKVNLGEGSFSPGNRYTVFPFPKAPFGVLICFEAIFPSQVRRYVYNGARVLLNITNDGWFGNTAGPYQHAWTNVFRAVENRCGLARSANTGISMFIDPYGRISGKLPLFTQGYKVAPVQLNEHMTFYTKYGDVFAYINIIVSLTFIIIGLLNIRWRKRAG